MVTKQDEREGVLGWGVILYEEIRRPHGPDNAYARPVGRVEASCMGVCRRGGECKGPEARWTLES